MSKYIIGFKNSEPAEPEFMYLCGPKSPVVELKACVTYSELLLDTNPDTAMIFYSVDEIAEAYEFVTNLVYSPELIFAMKRVTTYVPIDAAELSESVIRNHILRIVNTMDSEDIKYLSKVGVLDLTNVT